MILYPLANYSIVLEPYLEQAQSDFYLSSDQLSQLLSFQYLTAESLKPSNFLNMLEEH